MFRWKSVLLLANKIMRRNLNQSSTEDLQKNISEKQNDIPNININNISNINNNQEKSDFNIIQESLKEQEKTTIDLSKWTTEELYNKCEFNVYKGSEEAYEDEDKWYLYKSICKLGGCDYDGISFNSEREALEEGVKLSLKGEQPYISGACDECYKEYINGCI